MFTGETTMAAPIKGIISLILGLVSIFVWDFFAIIAIIAIILGNLSRKSEDPKAIGIIGMVLGIIAVVVWIIAAVLLGALLALFMMI